MPKRGNVAGFMAMQVWRNYNGAAYGQLTDPANVTPNTTTHAYLVRDVISSGISDVTRDVATFRGPSFLGQMYLGVSGVSAFDIQVPTFDADLDALITGSKVDETSILNATISGTNSSNADLPPFGLMLTARFQSRDSGTDGELYYFSIVFPNVTMFPTTPALNSQGGDNPSAITYRVAPTYAGKFPWAEAFGANQGFEANRTDHFRIVARNPFAVTTYIANGTATNFTLGYLPALNTVTSGRTNSVYAKGGVPTAPSSVNLTTGVVTLAAAGSSDDVHHAFYQTKFAAVP